MKSYTVVIQHNHQIADIGDMGHGKTLGVFTGNKLTLPARTIRDGTGSSKLSVADVDFFPDCSGFVGYYTWQYADSSMSCSGNTKVWGKRLDGKGCPAVAQKSAEQQRQELADIRANPDIASKERRYKEILEKDPKNFWANWDMAELRKKQGNYNEFFNYFNKAASNENIFADTREKLKKEEARRLRLSEFPTAGKSPILRIEQGELDNWWRTPIYNVNVPKEVAAGKGWGITIWRLLVPEDKANNIVDKAIYE